MGTSNTTVRLYDKVCEEFDLLTDLTSSVGIDGTGLKVTLSAHVSPNLNAIESFLALTRFRNCFSVSTVFEHFFDVLRISIRRGSTHGKLLDMFPMECLDVNDFEIMKLRICPSMQKTGKCRCSATIYAL